MLLSKTVFVFLKNESLIQLDYVYENVKVQCGRQRPCRNIEGIDDIINDYLESKAPCRFQPCVVLS